MNPDLTDTETEVEDAMGQMETMTNLLGWSTEEVETALLKLAAKNLKGGSVRKMRIYNVKHFDTSLMRNYEVLI